MQLYDPESKELDGFTSDDLIRIAASNIPRMFLTDVEAAIAANIMGIVATAICSYYY